MTSVERGGEMSALEIVAEYLRHGVSNAEIGPQSAEKKAIS
jgi:hypothetical protein